MGKDKTSTEDKSTTETKKDTTFIDSINTTNQNIFEDFSDFEDEETVPETPDNPFPTGERTPLRPGKLHVERTEGTVTKGQVRRK